MPSPTGVSCSRSVPRARALGVLASLLAVTLQAGAPAGWVCTLEGTGDGSVAATDRFPNRRGIVRVEDSTPEGRVLARSLFGSAVELGAEGASVEIDVMVEESDQAFYGMDILLNAAPRDWRHSADLLFTRPKSGPMKIVTYDGRSIHELAMWELGRWYRIRFDAFDTASKTYSVTVGGQRFPNQKLRGSPTRFRELCVRTDRRGKVKAYVANVRPAIGVEGMKLRGPAIPSLSDGAALAKIGNVSRKVGPHGRLTEDDEFVYCHSAKLGFVFEKKRLTLVKLFDMGRRANLLANPTGQPLWELLLKDGAGGSRECLVSNFDATTTETEIVDEALRLTWRGVRAANGAVLPLNVIADLRFASPDAARWKARVESADTTRGIWHLDLPKLAFRRTESAEQTYLAVPKMFGLWVRNPFAGRSAAFSHFSIHRGATYPGWLNMNFFLLTDQVVDQGMYVHCRDSGGRYKQFLFDPDPFSDSLRCTVRHSPDDLGAAGEPLDIPYETETALVRGDWYDACQRYREWAIRQPWCARGPLASRAGQPHWFSRVPLAFGVFSNEPAGSGQIPGLVEDLIAYRRYFELPMYVVWYYWNRYDPQQTIFKERRPGVPRTSNYHAGSQFAPKAEFAEAVKRLAAEDISVVPFVPTRLFDQGVQDADAARPWVVKNPLGKLTLYSASYGTWEICNSARWWHERLSRICSRLTSDLSIKGFYIDTHGISQHPCFDPTHGHPLGGGNFQAASQNALSRHLQQELRKIDPDVILQNECGSENFIDTVDARLVHVNVWEPGGFAPLYTAVYHDYQTEYGHRIAFGDAKDGDPINLMTAANLFVHGMQIGRMYPSWGKKSFANRWATDPFFHEQLAFVRKLARYRHHAWRFLGVGKFLRPLDLGPLPMVYTTNNQTITTKGMRCGLPVVLSSVWRAANGDVAVALVNLGKDTRQVSVSLGRGPDALDRGRAYGVSIMDEERKLAAIGRVELDQAFRARVEVEPLDIRFYVLRPD